MTNPSPGIYRHNKSLKQYRVVGTAYHSETMEQLVVYQALYDTPDLGHEPLFVRPLGMWNELVDIDGELKPRFELVQE